MIKYISSLFSLEELQVLNQLIERLPASSYRHHKELGRVNIEFVETPKHFTDKLTALVNDVYNSDLEMNWPPLCVEYSSKYGAPELRPHFDGDFNEVIIDYQLSSSSNLGTEWPIGINMQTFSLKDNDAVMFNPNANIHWRPRKTFHEGEYVRMMFFRFFKSTNKSDYSYLPNHPDDPVFAEVCNFRDSLETITP
jgi:hypothetical protein